VLIAELLPTGSFVVKVVVILRHVGDNAQLVGHGHRQHVFRVEQGRNAKIFTGYVERLQNGIAE